MFPLNKKSIAVFWLFDEAANAFFTFSSVKPISISLDTASVDGAGVAGALDGVSDEAGGEAGAGAGAGAGAATGDGEAAAFFLDIIHTINPPSLIPTSLIIFALSHRTLPE
jgi:hypothetical protein